MLVKPCGKEIIFTYRQNFIDALTAIENIYGAGITLVDICNVAMNPSSVAPSHLKGAGNIEALYGTTVDGHQIKFYVSPSKSRFLLIGIDYIGPNKPK